MKKKACKSCKMLVETGDCPACKKNQFSNKYQGEIVLINLEKSEIGKIMGFENKGEYAIKISK